MNEAESFNLPSDSSSPSTKYEQLQSEHEALRKMFVAALCAVLLLSLALFVFLLRQMIFMRKDLEAIRPQVSQIVEAYARNEEPQIRNFVNTLVVYGRSHPDFNPILGKYKIVSEIPAPTISNLPAASTAPAPAKK